MTYLEADRARRRRVEVTFGVFGALRRSADDFHERAHSEAEATGLPPRVRNVLARSGLLPSDSALFTDSELLDLPNLARVSLSQLRSRWPYTGREGSEVAGEA